MTTQTNEFQTIYLAVDRGLMETHFIADSDRDFAFQREDQDGHAARFDVLFPTARPGMFLRAEGRLPTPSGDPGYCRLVLATADPDDLDETYAEVREMTVNGGRTLADYSVSSYSLRLEDADAVLLTKTLLDVAAEVMTAYREVAERVAG